MERWQPLLHTTDACPCGYRSDPIHVLLPTKQLANTVGQTSVKVSHILVKVWSTAHLLVVKHGHCAHSWLVGQVISVFAGVNECLQETAGCSIGVYAFTAPCLYGSTCKAQAVVAHILLLPRVKNTRWAADCHLKHDAALRHVMLLLLFTSSAV
jgi:hypothetical protein